MRGSQRRAAPSIFKTQPRRKPPTSTSPALAASDNVGIGTPANATDALNVMGGNGCRAGLCTPDSDGDAGESISLQAGNGGDGIFFNFSDGGAGAGISLKAGNGGIAGRFGFGGSGGSITLQPGTGGDRNVSFGGNPGADGNLLLAPTSGSVGIGIAAPTSKLHVVGNALINGTLSLTTLGLNAFWQIG